MCPALRMCFFEMLFGYRGVYVLRNYNFKKTQRNLPLKLLKRLYCNGMAMSNLQTNKVQGISVQQKNFQVQSLRVFFFFFCDFWVMLIIRFIIKSESDTHTRVQ